MLLLNYNIHYPHVTQHPTRKLVADSEREFKTIVPECLNPVYSGYRDLGLFVGDNCLGLKQSRKDLH